ncbi:hypothetical protein JYT74_03600, partial [Crocinitomix catalasitica]|nr:hypothetical protein [Crocinitomix catalasitica]
NLHEQALRAVQREKFDLQLELKNKELTTLTMQMLKKSEDMSGLQENLKGLEEKVMSNTTQDLNLVHSIRSISREIKSSMGQDQEWDQFRLYFEQVHENFFTQLKNKHPRLTAYDLKLCAYFHMNLGIKQVANIMNVSHDAIKKQRTRMRKKMGLKNEVNLLNYLVEAIE